MLQNGHLAHAATLHVPVHPVNPMADLSLVAPVCLCWLQQEVRRSIISATAATSLMACFLMGAVANLPLAVAPGMGEALSQRIWCHLPATRSTCSARQLLQHTLLSSGAFVCLSYLGKVTSSCIAQQHCSLPSAAAQPD
jgi:xanthine/uracil/vitamin C permease (AzgA family)